MADTRSDTPQITVASDPEDSSSAEPSSGRCSSSSSPREGTVRPEERQSTFSLRSSPIGNVLKDSRPSSMMSFGGGSESTSPMRFAFLRPSQLTSPEKFGSSPTFGDSAGKSSSACPLKPARLGNPFAVTKEPEPKDEPSSTVAAAAPAAEAAGAAAPEADAPSTSTSLSTPTVQPSSTMPKFVPLGMPSTQTRPQTTPAPAPAPVSSSVSGFVFGQNLHERVTETPSESGAEKPKEAMDTTNNGCVASTSNGTTENLFTSVLKREHAEKNNDSGSESGSERPNKSLSEAAREYEEARAVKRKYEEVAVVTGEEDEVNILQINCKLFAYDKGKSSWVERGRGNLRLNDKDLGNSRRQSRVIMRATGSLRVVLNTKLWAGMVVEKVSTKSVRLTAQDSSGEILVFLVMASPKDADALFNYMDARVTTLRTTGAGAAAEGASLPASGPASGPATDPAPEPEAQPSNSRQEGQPAKKLATDASGDPSGNPSENADSDISDPTIPANDSSREDADSGGKGGATEDSEAEKKEGACA